eukprot:scaffold63255_cov60-Phaeocystis_antarctica.AAC.2
MEELLLRQLGWSGLPQQRKSEPRLDPARAAAGQTAERAHADGDGRATGGYFRTDRVAVKQRTVGGFTKFLTRNIWPTAGGYVAANKPRRNWLVEKSTASGG